MSAKAPPSVSKLSASLASLPHGACRGGFGTGVLVPPDTVADPSCGDEVRAGRRGLHRRPTHRSRKRTHCECLPCGTDAASIHRRWRRDFRTNRRRSANRRKPSPFMSRTEMASAWSVPRRWARKAIRAACRRARCRGAACGTRWRGRGPARARWLTSEAEGERF